MPEGKVNKAVIQTFAGMPNWGRDGTIAAVNHPPRFRIRGACFEAITAEVFFDWKLWKLWKLWKRTRSRRTSTTGT